MVSLAITARPKWLWVGFTALALIAGLGNMWQLDMTATAYALDDLPEEEAPPVEDANPAPAEPENGAEPAAGAGGEHAEPHLSPRSAGSPTRYTPRCCQPPHSRSSLA